MLIVPIASVAVLFIGWLVWRNFRNEKKFERDSIDSEPDPINTMKTVSEKPLEITGKLEKALLKYLAHAARGFQVRYGKHSPYLVHENTALLAAPPATIAITARVTVGHWINSLLLKKIDVSIIGATF